MEAIVIYEGSQGDGGIVTYRGNDKLKLLQAIVNDHIYRTQKKTEQTLLKFLEDNNGDGCNFIYAIFIDNKPYYLDRFIVHEKVIEIS